MVTLQMMGLPRVPTQQQSSKPNHEQDDSGAVTIIVMFAMRGAGERRHA